MAELSRRRMHAVTHIQGGLPMIWIIAAGVYNLGFGLFHLTFWRLLNWKEELLRLSATNRAVMQTLNLCITLFFLLGAYLFLVYTEEIRDTGVGGALAVGMMVFWTVRSVLQLVLFDLRKAVHRILLGIFVAGVILHGAMALL